MNGIYLLTTIVVSVVVSYIRYILMSNSCEIVNKEFIQKNEFSEVNIWQNDY